MGKLVNFEKIGSGISARSKKGNSYIRLYLDIEIITAMHKKDIKEKIYLFYENKSGDYTVMAPVKKKEIKNERLC